MIKNVLKKNILEMGDNIFITRKESFKYFITQNKIFE